MSVAAVVVAAGQGVRFRWPPSSSPSSTTTPSPRTACAPHDPWRNASCWSFPLNYDGKGEGADVVVVGGPTRAQSVRAGLAQCDDADVVVVHDAARPMASAALFDAVVSAVTNGADAAVPGIAISDTVKRVTSDGVTSVVTETVPRSELVTVQTPQAFRREVLVRAHASGAEATDDAALVEAIGGRVVVVPGEPQNVKITEPSDLSILASTVRS